MPLPATVVIVPPVEIFRMRALSLSRKYRVPSGAAARKLGLLISADVPGPLSPENPATPTPAIVVIV